MKSHDLKGPKTTIENHTIFSFSYFSGVQNGLQKKLSVAKLENLSWGVERHQEHQNRI